LPFFFGFSITQVSANGVPALDTTTVREFDGRATCRTIVSSAGSRQCTDDLQFSECVRQAIEETIASFGKS
jgi:hypothetical protein